MILFLYGKDTYRMHEKLKEIIRHYNEIHKSGLSLRYFNCQELNNSAFNSFKDEIHQISIFQEKKLAVVSNPFTSLDFKEKFLKEAENFLESSHIILFYEQGEVNKKEKLFKFLEKKAQCQEFKLLSGRQLKNWAEKKIKERKTEINPEALEALCSYIGDDLWRMSNEIEKLASFRPGGVIEKKDVQLLVRPKLETDIFKTIDAVSQKDKKQALKLLYKHLEKGDSPLYLLSMINYQFRNLLIVKDLVEKQEAYGAISKKSGLHPFVMRKSYYQSQKFSFLELKKIYRSIFQADNNIKTGKIEPAAALDMLTVEI